MVYQTVLLFDIPLPFALYGFVFCGSVCSYNFHWYLTPPNVGGPSEKVIWNIKNKDLHLGLFLIGLIGGGVFAFLLIKYWFWLCLTAFVTFLYSAPKISHPLFAYLRKIAVAKTFFLAFAWTHITALLPLVLHSPYLTDAQIWFVVNRFFLIYPICVLFDFRDVESDKKDNIKSMITSLDERGIDIIFWGSVIAFFLSIGLLIPVLPALTALALAVPGILLCFLYYPSKKESSDYLYYFILDGLMMASAPFVVLVNFLSVKNH
jgi:hypothetical protein